MNILSVIDTIKQLGGKTNFEIETFLHSEWRRGLDYGAMSEHTTLSGLQYGAVCRDRFRLKITLTHKCPIMGFREKRIRKAPYFCKNCALPIVTAEQGPGMALEVDRGVIPKIQISLAGLDFYREKGKDFDMGDLLLTRREGWVHKCSAITPPKGIQSQVAPLRGAQVYHYTEGKQTITGFPFKCKECKKLIGEEGLTFQKMVALASVLRIK